MNIGIISIQPIKGYIQEGLTYLTFPFREKRQAIKKFVILSLPRSGSSLLVSLLDSHPSIHCEGELFYYRKLFPLTYLETRNRFSKKTVFGFKLMPQHIARQKIQNPRKFMEYLIDSGYSIIKLYRRNLLLCALSLLYAEKSGKFHYNLSERVYGLPKLSLEPSELIEKLARFQELAILQKSLTESLPHLEIIYEDHLINSSSHQDTVNQITDYLGVTSAPVYSDLAKISEENPGECITNFDEIAAMLQGTNAVEYLQNG